MSILTRDMWLEILEQRMERPLIQLLDELGGWPILRPNWDPEKFDWLLLVAQLRLYNNDILISEWVAPDIKNSDQYVIQVEISNSSNFYKCSDNRYFIRYSNVTYFQLYYLLLTIIPLSLLIFYLIKVLNFKV